MPCHAMREGKKELHTHTQKGIHTHHQVGSKARRAPQLPGSAPLVPPLRPLCVLPLLTTVPPAQKVVMRIDFITFLRTVVRNM